MPPKATRKAPAARVAQPGAAADVAELEPYKKFINEKADREELQRLFYSELELGVVSIDELIERKNALFVAGKIDEGFDSQGSSVRAVIKDRIQFEILQNLSNENYKKALEDAVSNKNYDFDTGVSAPEFYQKIEEYKKDDIVFFVKRSTTVKLDVPCRNCGKKELFMEQPKQTARADEQIVKYARCANCQMRMNAQWLL